ncbi:P-loop containing nucleoside triphosphate hydrolase protein [Aspergillus sclerotioniger CBS 115572]|uniref:P-loop containing nucleoside triphosphate hydrolase protein n=1 Tax=Aspergillus sclerotioniger CBS 115572 TaxID=1450535 RepID=A0A317W9P6_9EURO|nr:P-loop containing nucleoside triphosphate hydrolase protein [Aspergillus sclerotioniger CBS 115572]PWY80810.1 P-loop containing nucleoside triphosphate hydrolase protein [Aspergillus sclerotioniger CBS 115572]
MGELGMRCGFPTDDHFGPRVLPCRREFDLTLLFEQTILGLGPDLLFLVLCPLRWYQIHARLRRVNQRSSGRWKTVSNGLYKRQAIRVITMIRARFVGMIYAETLHQVSKSSHESSSVTLMSTDADRITTGWQLWPLPYVRTPKFLAWASKIVNNITNPYKRVSFTSAILKGMRQIKMFGIEPTVETKINRLREVELESSKPYRSLIVWVNVLGAVSTALAPAVTIAVYAGMQLNLGFETPKTNVVFTSLSLISLLTNPVVLISVSLTRPTSAIGCFDRIQDFLSEEGKRPQVADRPLITGIVSGIEMNTMRLDTQELVSMNGACFSLPTGSSNSSTPSTSKSSIPRFRIFIAPVRKAYCQQCPWIFNGTLQTNIVGESPIDVKWLKEVVYACNLDVDVARLSHGIDTVVGTSGSQLSGGQKQRVALARAIYAKPDLLLLDDVISALDSVTCKRVVERIFGRSGLIRRLGIATVLVTAAAECFQEAENVIVLSSNGRIVDQGSLEDLSVKNEYIRELMCRTGSKQDENEVEDADAPSEETETQADNHGPRVAQEPTPNTRGTGDLSLYAYYINSFGWWAFCFTLTFATIYVLCVALSQLMLTWWADSTPGHNYVYLGSYMAVSTVAIPAIGVFIGFFFVWTVPRSAINLHKVLLGAVMRAPWPSIARMDTGSLINRFSQDMSLLDMQLPVAFGITLQNFLTCLAQAALIATGAGYMSIVISFCIGAVWTIQAFYLRTSRQIRLLDLEAKAPLYAHFLETTEGLIIVRAFQWQQRFSDRNARLLNTFQKPFYTMYCIQQWLQVVLDLLVAALATVLTALAVFVTRKTSSRGVGMALVNLLSFNSTLTLLITNWTQLETSLGAIARVKQFVNDPQVRPVVRNEMAVEDWPSMGRLEFRGVTASYSEVSPPIIKNISFTLEPGHKLSICGRTGSGKSTLLSCLFSLVTLTSGEIYIDNIDIFTLPKDRLHSAIVPIPQHPLIIPGSVRENLSLGTITTTDEAMISALSTVHLWTQILEHGGLDADIQSIHMSNRQQQLLCISRALLLPGSLVVLDEPTSGFDEQTEKMVQDVLSEGLRGRTVISVAHRIRTIMDSDVVVVMDEGRFPAPAPTPPHPCLTSPHPHDHLVIDTDPVADKTAQIIEKIQWYVNIIHTIIRALRPSNLPETAQKIAFWLELFLYGIGIYKPLRGTGYDYGDIVEMFGFTSRVGEIWNDEIGYRPEGLNERIAETAGRWPHEGVTRRKVSIVLHEMYETVKETHGADNLRFVETRRMKRTLQHGFRIRHVHGTIDFSLWFGDLDNAETNLLVKIGTNHLSSEVLLYMGLLQRDQQRLKTRKRGIIYGIMTDGSAYHFYRLDPDKTNDVGDGQVVDSGYLNRWDGLEWDDLDTECEVASLQSMALTSNSNRLIPYEPHMPTWL